MRDFVNEEIEVLRAAGGPSGGPLPAHNRSGDDPVLQRLIEGLNRIRKNWCIGRTRRFTNDGIAYCALGAMLPDGTWFTKDDVFHDAYVVLGGHLPAQPALLPDDIAYFNNNSSQAEVIALFDRAIAARKSELEG